MRLVLPAGNVCAAACAILLVTGHWRLSAAVLATFAAAMACLLLDLSYRRRSR